MIEIYKISNKNGYSKNLIFLTLVKDLDNITKKGFKVLYLVWKLLNQTKTFILLCKSKKLVKSVSF